MRCTKTYGHSLACMCECWHGTLLRVINAFVHHSSSDVLCRGLANVYESSCFFRFSVLSVRFLLLVLCSSSRCVALSIRCLSVVCVAMPLQCKLELRNIFFVHSSLALARHATSNLHLAINCTHTFTFTNCAASQNVQTSPRRSSHCHGNCRRCSSQPCLLYTSPSPRDRG